MPTVIRYGDDDVDDVVDDVIQVEDAGAGVKYEAEQSSDGGVVTGKYNVLLPGSRKRDRSMRYLPISTNTPPFPGRPNDPNTPNRGK